ncbi:MAG: GNAT family N-acetyltransferase [Anaerolineae bacterium]|nr:GNAT family N-acetyltransferase [Anaerolineae bacterium]
MTMRPYDHDKDFLRVRDFLVTTYGHFRRSYNWTIERWNFSVSLARTMHAISLDVWAAQIGIWEAAGEIQAVVNAEGEDDGEAFFQLRHEDLPKALLPELFAFCEARMGKVEGDARRIRLYVPAGDVRLERMAAEHGYAREGWVDHDGVLTVGDAFPVALPEGYTFADGAAVSAEEKGAAHAAAFGYAGEPPYPERAIVGFRRMQATPDYRADLDLHVRAPDGRIVSFATMWYDAQNRIGILEPVGTAPAYRRSGLGRAAIYEGINRIRAEGAVRVHVGSDQAFYQRIGFVIHDKYTVWQKHVI